MKQEVTSIFSDFYYVRISKEIRVISCFVFFCLTFPVWATFHFLLMLSISGFCDNETAFKYRANFCLLNNTTIY